MTKDYFGLHQPPKPVTIKDKILSFDRGIHVKELAAIVGVSVQVLRRYARERVIPSFKIGAATLFDPAEAAAWYEGQRSIKNR